MIFTMDDIEQALQIVRDLEDVKDVELHIDTGEMKFSVWKGRLAEAG